jgi:hypothetical protein
MQLIKECNSCENKRVTLFRTGEDCKFKRGKREKGSSKALVSFVRDRYQGIKAPRYSGIQYYLVTQLKYHSYLHSIHQFVIFIKLIIDQSLCDLSFSSVECLSQTHNYFNPFRDN